ncbi:tetratricopeptide repeat protein [Streptomonospora litoralis]|uniref:Tetratricopeptide repeat protein n=1 Tax=Streptomonospora litoralis TaxID=2498135 RepID=A0A4P6QAI0_9ACTN|nr:tetratricopeptide repeat protein [Streptomonospora litoralis]QBI56454.1 Tetratricopeptide repeat protein [Streptomonospora litoralis]
MFWLRPESVLDAMLRVAIELGASQAEAEQMKATPVAARRWVWRHLHGSSQRWLIVFDNVDRPVEFCDGRRPGDEDAWIRGSRAGLTLVTTRIDRPELWRPAHLLRVVPLGYEDSIAVFNDHAAGPDAGPFRLPAAAGEVARRVGGIPLALRLLGSVVGAYRTGNARYEAALELLNRSLDDLDALAEPVLAVQGDAGEAERGLLSRVWEFSLSLLDDEVPQARPLLQVLSFLSVDGLHVAWEHLPREVLRGSVVDAGPQELTPWVLERAVNSLRAHGLVEVHGAGADVTVSLHPLVSEVARTRLGEGAFGVAAAVHRLIAAPGGEDLAVEAAAYRCICEARERELGAQHVLTLAARFGLAYAVLERGATDEAEELFNAVLRDWQETYGAEASGVLLTRHELGRIAVRRDDWGAAEREFRRVSELEEAGVRGWHPWTGRHGLALVAFQQGDFAAAEAEFREVVRLREQACGPRDVGTMLSRHELGRVALSQGNLDEAEQSFRAVLGVLEDVPGPTSPQTLATRYELAKVLLERSGDTRTAEDEFEAVLELQQRVLGTEHVRTRRTLDQLDALRQRGKS